jgi:hypothetical protein
LLMHYILDRTETRVLQIGLFSFNLGGRFQFW